MRLRLWRASSRKVSWQRLNHDMPLQVAGESARPTSTEYAGAAADC